ncbi:MAG: M61 family metallopeptidase [Bacteroidetes bacterium]|nr:M61 family metallopeptidase [Bacteroidota bacterium]
MNYKVYHQQPSNHYINIEYTIDKVTSNELLIQLPAWRPGRYELGNFAKNVQKWEAFDEKGKSLKSEKIKKDLWKVQTKGTKTVVVKYNYYAAELNAGSSYLDESQLYVNPVNCFLYVHERINEPCEIELIIPKNFKVATGLISKGKNKFNAKDFHELADSPFIASSNLKHHVFTEQKVNFNVWFNGECKPDFKKIETDFRKFCKAQIDAFGSFPVKDYHFLIQVLPYKAYHGVEHYNSTVITIGPSYDVFNNPDWYDELLGVSSHELYHTWNVKQIRPIEMFPYDYTKENYSELGYLCEGVTTYMGDKMLFVAGVFNWNQYAKTFDELLLKHYHNTAIKNYSVAQSSFDTWLDGYVKGTPGRKTSIYTEGALIAFITDVFILKSTKNKKSLNDVMKMLYTDFAKKGKGVSDSDFKSTVEKIAGKSFDNIYKKLIHGTAEYTPFIKESLNYIGCGLKIEPTKNFNESYLGFKVRYENNKCLVDTIYPGSVAEYQGLSVNDEILAINGYKIVNDLEQWSNYINKDEHFLIVKKELGLMEPIILKSGKEMCFKTYSITIVDSKNKNSTHWKK